MTRSFLITSAIAAAIGFGSVPALASEPRLQQPGGQVENCYFEGVNICIEPRLVVVRCITTSMLAGEECPDLNKSTRNPTNIKQSMPRGSERQN